MLTRIVMLFALATTVLLQGCFEADPLPQDERIDGIVRILMHEPGHYTLLLQESSVLIRELEIRRGYNGSSIYVPDVAPGQPMWLAVHLEREEHGQDLKHFNFHIHTAEDINGAGWNHGKFGSGQTSVIQ